MLLFLTLLPMAGGIFSFIAGKFNRKFRDYFADLICIIELLSVIYSYKYIGTSLHVEGVCGFGLNFMLDGFRFIYALIIAFMWSATTIFSREYLEHHHNRNRYYLYVLMTFGSIMGVFLSADFYTTFIFFEMMSLFSYVMVVQDETPDALRAAQTYLAIAIIGGLVTLTGLIFLYAKTGTFEFSKLINISKEGLYIPGILIFVGFAAKAAIFPSHIWLPTAHTAAPAPSSALLSGLLTKSGLFGILVLSSGIFIHDSLWGFILLILALITMFLGAVLAVFSVNIKRTLACSSMSQLGFILTGISMQCFLGVENDLAIRGTILYMIGHSLIKLVLFLCAGVVHMNTHKLNLNDIKGFGKGKIIFLFAFLMGGLGLMGAPLLNGYLGKTLVHEAIVEQIHMISKNGVGTLTFLSTINEKFLFELTEWLFLISGGLTTAYVMKLFYVLFIAKPSEHLHQKEKYITPLNAFVLTLSAITFPIFGFMPYDVADRVSVLGSGFMNSPEHHHFINYFSFESLEGAIISITIGIAVYFLFIQKFLIAKKSDGSVEFLDLWWEKLNIENLIFRPLLGLILPFIGSLFAKLTDLITASPVSYLLENAARIKFIRPLENTDFGYYHDESKSETIGSLLPSSLAYGLLTFAFGFLAVLAFLLL